jgi:hypothetical protein
MVTSPPRRFARGAVVKARRLSPPIAGHIGNDRMSPVRSLRAERNPAASHRAQRARGRAPGVVAMTRRGRRGHLVNRVDRALSLIVVGRRRRLQLGSTPGPLGVGALASAGSREEALAVKKAADVLEGTGKQRLSTPFETYLSGVRSLASTGQLICRLVESVAQCRRAGPPARILESAAARQMCSCQSKIDQRTR